MSIRADRGSLPSMSQSPSGTPTPEPSGLRRALVPVLGVSLLVAVAYLIAGSRGGSPDAWFGVPELLRDNARDFTLAALLLLSVIAIPLTIRAMLVRMRLGPAERQSSLLAGIVLLLLTVLGVWLFLRMVPPGAFEFPFQEVPVEPFNPAEGEIPVPEPESAAGVVVWLGILVVGAGAFVLYKWMQARRRPLIDLPESKAKELVTRRRVLIGLLDEAIEVLRNHPDQREATIAAWARLEAAVDVVGVTRRPSDTPSQFLGRVLGTVATSGPAVERLAAAFERAMFSPHTIDRQTQLESVDALVAVRDELGVLDRVVMEPVSA